ncbi:hypothetical protein B0H14DRAFT_3488888 [Mycena olivaceomarginata]|nr:hypothetical protein B0H14DRAFT_3488888 [Mycena olivaceomarginata]
MDTEICDEDAREFKPECWESLPDAVILVPGVWANLLTSFAGTTNYIGPRLKALLFTLIRAFEFEAAVLKGGIQHASNLQPDLLRWAHPHFMAHIVSLFAEFPFDLGSGPVIVASTT